MRKEPMHACLFAVQNLENATKSIEIATNLFSCAIKSLVNAISPPTRLAYYLSVISSLLCAVCFAL